jgi:hypothetical protein
MFVLKRLFTVFEGLATMRNYTEVFIGALIGFTCSFLPAWLALSAPNSPIISWWERLYWHLALVGVGAFAVFDLRQSKMRLTSNPYYEVGTAIVQIVFSKFVMPVLVLGSLLFCEFKLSTAFLKLGTGLVMIGALAILNSLLVRRWHKKFLPVFMGFYPNGKVGVSSIRFGAFFIPFQGKRSKEYIGDLVGFGFSVNDDLRTISILRQTDILFERIQIGLGDWEDDGILESICHYLQGTPFSEYSVEWVYGIEELEDHEESDDGGPSVLV